MSDQQLMKNEAENIGREAQQDAGFLKLLKFKKGDYFCDGEEVPMGSVFLAHCKSWTKAWIHFEDKKVVERKIYRIALGERAPERDQIPDNDQAAWAKDPTGKPQDPWSHQYLVPFENMETGDVRIFVGSSFGARRAVGELCSTWAKRCSREQKNGQPLVKLGVTTFPTKNWGDVKRPVFEIIGWDDTATGDQVKAVDIDKVKYDQFNDDIPF